jgi:hypothetical protein
MGHLKAWKNSLATETWKYILTDKDLPTLKSGISKLLSMFRSTWVCESTISTMGFIKSKYRCHNDDVHLEGELRCALSSDIQPTFLQLVRQNIAKFRIKCSIFFSIVPFCFFIKICILCIIIPSTQHFTQVLWKRYKTYKTLHVSAAIHCHHQVNLLR